MHTTCTKAQQSAGDRRKRMTDVKKFCHSVSIHLHTCLFKNPFNAFARVANLFGFKTKDGAENGNENAIIPGNDWKNGAKNA